MIQKIDLSLITPGPNDRKNFDRDKLQELADSIKAYGLIQPITLRQVDVDGDYPLYEIVAGERRFRAVQLLGWSEIEANVKDLTEEEASAMMLAENVARDDLNPIEEAEAYQSRIDRFGKSVADLAKEAGVSVTRVRFRLKLLSLREDARRLVKTGQLPIGYAQILADAQLNDDFQLVAMRYLRQNQKPTPAWFRRAVGDLAEKQNQASLFELPILGGQLLTAPAPVTKQDPPLPGQDDPQQVTGDTLKEKMTFTRRFWLEAAAGWEKLGKNFKRDQCLAAASALEFAINMA